MLAIVPDRIAGLAHTLHTGRVARIAYGAAFVVCIFLISLARPDTEQSRQGIYDPGPQASIMAAYGRYVRLTGRLDMNRAYQTEMRLGPITLRGGRYIPFSVPGLTYELYVLDADLPAPNPDGTYTVVGQLVAGAGQQPSLYFEISYPPDVSLQNTLARIGVAGAIALLLAGMATRQIRKADYALSAGPRNQANSLTGGPEWLWYGSLGAACANIFVRQMTVRVESGAQAGRLVLTPTDGNACPVIISRLRSARRDTIATAYGARPGARVTFEDERGLTRNGTLAARSADARDALLARLEALKAGAG